MNSVIKGMDGLIGEVVRMRDKARKPAAPLKQSAEVTGVSIRRNFEVGGRPRWKRHAESTRRSRVGPSRLLIQSTELMNSFKPFVSRSSAGQRSSTVYGPRQNFGYKGGSGRGHSPTPAREFALFQREDAVRSGDLFLNHVT